MIHTLRTPLAVGAIAVIGAVAVVTTPHDNADRLRIALTTTSSVPVALAAWQNPFVALLDSGEMAENYVFGGYYNGADAPTPGAGEANWPAAGFDQTGGDVLNYLLTQQPALGNYFYVGFLENFAAEAYLPAVQQLQINVENNISVVLSGLNRAARALATGDWAGAAQSVIGAATYVVNGVVARAGAVIAALPQIVTTFAGWAVGSASILAQQSAAVVTGVVSSLSSLDIEGAWNAAVDGLLAPPGIMGSLLNLTTGAGVQTGPIVNPVTDIRTNFVPSFRTSLQSAQWTLRGALETEPETAVTAAAAAVTAAVDPAPRRAKASRSEAAPRGGERADDRAERAGRSARQRS